MAAVPNSKYFRHRLYPRLRYGRKLKAFLADEATALASSATGQVVAPLRTVNTKAEATIVVAGQLSAADTLTIGLITYIFKAALTEARATGTLTNDGTNVANTDTVTVGGKTYTFKTALTEAKASGTLTNDGTNVTDGDTVTIGGKTYTFQTTLTNVDGNVHIGASNTASMTNLFHAINATGGTPGTDYATGMTANLQVVATNPTGTTVVATALSVGVAGNAIASTENSTHLAWGAATLAGGVDSIANEVAVGASNVNSMTHLFDAINGAGGSIGVDYSSATTANANVTATNPTGTTVVVTANIGSGTAGNAITTTETAAHLSWGAATLAGGVNSVANEILIDDTAAHTRDNMVLAITAGSNAGVKYSSATVAHPLVTAAASGSDLLVSALLASTHGLQVPLSKSAANLSLPTVATLDGPLWTATGHTYTNGEGPVLLTSSTTLPAGTPTTELWVHVFDANTVAFATSKAALETGNFIQTTDAGTGTHTATKGVTSHGIFDLLQANKPRTIVAATDIDNLN